MPEPLDIDDEETGRSRELIDRLRERLRRRLVNSGRLRGAAGRRTRR